MSRHLCFSRWVSHVLWDRVDGNCSFIPNSTIPPRSLWLLDSQYQKYISFIQKVLFLKVTRIKLSCVESIDPRNEVKFFRSVNTHLNRRYFKFYLSGCWLSPLMRTLYKDTVSNYAKILFQMYYIAFLFTNHKESPIEQFTSINIRPHQRQSGFTLKTGRQELPGSLPGRACRPSRSEFSVVFSETRVNTRNDPLKRPLRRALHP